MQGRLGWSSTLQDDRRGNVSPFFVSDLVLVALATNGCQTISFVSSDVDYFIAPCGACRQFIAEFGLDWEIMLIKNKKEVRVISVSEILPHAFDSSALVEE